MIQITRNWDGEAYCLHIHGHAEDAPAGQSPICGAVSILYHTIHRVLEKCGAEFHRDRHEKGEAWLHAGIRREAFERVATVEEGFRLLAESEPESVHLTVRDLLEMSTAPR